MAEHKIKILFMDVDGTLTDGKIYMGENGEVMKAFDIKDGYAIAHMLPEMGIIPVIITGRTSKIVENRAKELGITELYQGRNDKLDVMFEVMKKYNCEKENCAYIGDDVFDIPCMKECAIAACPVDAVQEVKDVCQYVCKNVAGHGTVRDFIEIIKGM
jgi:3-deoxy-D-manno-octulosonate 8-phosphate phosphatase (KDO 8-P phosphatase)